MEAALGDVLLERLVRAILGRDHALAMQLLAASPELAKTAFEDGASRQAPKPYYAGDTALHAAAAVYDMTIVRELIARGADVRARNRRGSEPLHSAAVGQPGSDTWNPTAQADTIATLIAVGADPNALNMDEATPLHRAVRTRCAGAVRALLDRGADPTVKNSNGSTPADLAMRTTGRGGSGSPEAKKQQQEILLALKRRGSKRP